MPLLKLPILRLRRFRLDRQQVFSFLRSDYPKLAAILGLAFYIAFIPHSDYPYPVHLDEWIHMADARAMMKAGEADATIPYHTYEMAGTVGNLEAGFHLLLGVFQEVSGVSWMNLFKYLPAIIFMFTVMCAYILGARRGFGWQAALMTCLISTTVGILGPGFLVPVALGLPIILIVFFVAFQFSHFWGYVSGLLLVGFLLCIHPPTALGAGILLVPYMLLNLKGSWKHAFGLASCFGIPLIPVALFIDRDVIRSYLEKLFESDDIAEHVLWPVLIRDYGYIPAVLCVVGALFLIKRGNKEAYGLTGGLILLALVLACYGTLHYGWVLIYNRGLLYSMLAMGIIGGYGLAMIGQLKLPNQIGNRDLPMFIYRNAGGLLCLSVVVAILIVAIPERQNTPYYHMLNDEDYKAFVWIRDNLDEEYERAILDPWKGVAFTAITGREAYSEITATPDAKAEVVYDFLSAGCEDTELIRNKGVSIVYSGRRCNNPDLVEVRNYVYILNPVDVSD